MCNDYDSGRRYTFYVVHTTYVRIIRNSQVTLVLQDTDQLISMEFAKIFYIHLFQLSHRAGSVQKYEKFRADCRKKFDNTSGDNQWNRYIQESN